MDLADVLPCRALERCFDEAEYLRLDCTGLLPIDGRPGNGRLRAVLAEHHAGTTRTRSGLEDLFLEVCASRGHARPKANTVLNGHEVAFLRREERLVVEVRISERRLESAQSQVAAQIRVLARS